MTDSGMIKWLRTDWEGLTSPKIAQALREIADRLEKLTTPPDKKPPVGEARMAELRKSLDGWQGREGEMSGSMYFAIRDLLAAYDHQEHHRVFAECRLQDYLHETDSRYDAGVKAMEAEVEAVLGRIHADCCRRRDLSSEHGDLDGFRAWGAQAEAVKHALDRIMIECGPGELPPHAQTYAECRRLRAALEGIAGQTPSLAPALERLARKALDGKS